MTDLYKLKVPTKQHAQPKFKRQPQATPGLDKRMKPREYHGEASYRGCGRLTNQKSLVTGGDSGIGRAVAIAYAREGADVAISYLPSEEADAREVGALIEQEGRKAIAPGPVWTPLPQKKIVVFGSETPMKRPGHPVEMATSWEGLKYRSACVNEDVRTSTSNVPQYPH